MRRCLLSVCLVLVLSSSGFAQDFNGAVHVVKDRIKWEVANRTPPDIRGIVYAIVSAFIDAIPDKFEEVTDVSE